MILNEWKDITQSIKVHPVVMHMPLLNTRKYNDSIVSFMADHGVPLDDELLQLMKILIMQNNKISEYYGKKNSYLFFSYKGTSIRYKVT